MKVCIVMGSKSDYNKLKDAILILKEFNVEVVVRALSAHRCHDQLAEFIKETKSNNVDVIIAAAGKAAHLPGVVAAMTTTPVIGLPISASVLDGMDALLSIVQMPPGIPVATVGIDSGKNAAILAIQIMSIKYNELKDKIEAYRNKMTQDCLIQDEKLQEEIKEIL